jgi:ATP-dependent DNA helicase RecG
MNTADPTALLDRLRAEPRESEWLEFKANPYEPQASVTNSRMQEITGEHAKDITGVLQGLVRDGLLTQQNQRRWASYRVAEDSPQSEGGSPHLAGDSPQSSPQSTGDSRHLAADSPHWPPELLSLAEPARQKKKLPAAEMEALVLRLCDARWLTSKELATLLGREAENLQSRILGGMVKKALLELKFPDVPNRPDQAHRTVPMQSEETP